MTGRRGFTLIELLIVLTVGTALLMLAMSALYALKETQSKVRQRLTDDRVAQRLADQFRDDAHSAQKVELAASELPTTTTWRFACGPDRTVQYDIEGNEVRRVATTGAKKIRETYRLRKGVTAKVSGAGAAGEILALELISADPAGERTPARRIEAVLAFDNRHGAPTDRTADR